MVGTAKPVTEVIPAKKIKHEMSERWYVDMGNSYAV